MAGPELSDALVDARIKHLLASSTQDARLGYIDMITTTNFAEYVKGMKIPMLVLTGARDAPLNRAGTVEPIFKKLYPHCQFEVLDSGHFMMDEVPSILVARIHQFMHDNSTVPINTPPITQREF